MSGGNGRIFYITVTVAMVTTIPRNISYCVTVHKPVWEEQLTTILYQGTGSWSQPSESHSSTWERESSLTSQTLFPVGMSSPADALYRPIALRGREDCNTHTHTHTHKHTHLWVNSCSVWVQRVPQKRTSQRWSSSSVSSSSTAWWWGTDNKQWDAVELQQFPTARRQRGRMVMLKGFRLNSLPSSRLYLAFSYWIWGLPAGI